MYRYNSVFKHYKNNYYRILNTAKHSETGEKLVIYQSLYGDLGNWARPKKMFEETVNGKKRFEYIGNLNDNKNITK